MIVTAIILAIIAAICDWYFGIKDPWRKIIYAGIVVLFVFGLILLLIPDLIPLRIGRW